MKPANRSVILVLGLVLSSLLAFGNSASGATSSMVSFQAEVWVDNWFSLYVNGKKVGEDSVPITTERSFNSTKVKFTASYPFTVGVVAKDFTENSSGLEYIGKPNQQIGDAGFIMQIRDSATGRLVASTNKTWKSLVLDKAPLNPSCVTSINPIADCKFAKTAIPAKWNLSTFKDASWKSATEFSRDEVGVKDGFFDFVWDAAAALIWSSDLKLDNTILLRKVIGAPPASAALSSAFQLSSPDFQNGGALPIDATCDGKAISPSLSWTGVPPKTESFAVTMDTIPGPLRPGETDIGKHFYLTLFNIPASTRALPAGATNIGTVGRNFKDSNLTYTPPCSQGGGANVYTITLYALSSTVSLSASAATESALVKAMEGRVITSSSMSVSYTRK